MIKDRKRQSRLKGFLGDDGYGFGTEPSRFSEGPVPVLLQALSCQSNEL